MHTLSACLTDYIIHRPFYPTTLLTTHTSPIQPITLLTTHTLPIQPITLLTMYIANAIVNVVDYVKCTRYLLALLTT